MQRGDGRRGTNRGAYRDLGSWRSASPAGQYGFGTDATVSVGSRSIPICRSRPSEIFAIGDTALALMPRQPAAWRGSGGQATGAYVGKPDQWPACATPSGWGRSAIATTAILHHRAQGAVADFGWIRLRFSFGLDDLDGPHIYFLMASASE